jgi:WD40 repeat protein
MPAMPLYCVPIGGFTHMLARVMSESDLAAYGARHLSPVHCLAFSPDDTLLATGDTSRFVVVWRGNEAVSHFDLRSKQEKLFGIERINGMSFTPDGQRLVVACGDLLRTFNLMTGTEQWSYRPPRSFGFLIISPIALAISKDGCVATSTNAGRIAVFDEKGRMTSHWADNDSPRQFAFVGDNLIGTDSFCVCVWDELGRKIRRRGLKDRAYGMAVSPDGTRLCIRTTKQVEELDPETLATINTYPIGYGLPLVDWSPDGKLLAVSDLQTVTVYEQGNGAVEQFSTNGLIVKSLRFSSKGSEVAAGCSDGSICRWELKA